MRSPRPASRAVVALSEERHHRLATGLAGVPVGDERLEAVADFDPYAAIVHGEQHQDPVVLALACRCRGRGSRTSSRRTRGCRAYGSIRLDRRDDHAVAGGRCSSRITRRSRAALVASMTPAKSLTGCVSAGSAACASRARRRERRHTARRRPARDRRGAGRDHARSSDRRTPRAARRPRGTPETAARISRRTDGGASSERQHVADDGRGRPASRLGVRVEAGGHRRARRRAARGSRAAREARAPRRPRAATTRRGPRRTRGSPRGGAAGACVPPLRRRAADQPASTRRPSNGSPPDEARDDPARMAPYSSGNASSDRSNSSASTSSGIARPARCHARQRRAQASRSSRPRSRRRAPACARGASAGTGPRRAGRTRRATAAGARKWSAEIGRARAPACRLIDAICAWSPRNSDRCCTTVESRNAAPRSERGLFRRRHGPAQPARRVEAQPVASRCTPSSRCSTAAAAPGSCATSWACCRPATSSSARWRSRANEGEARRVLLARLPTLEHARLAGHTGGNLLLSMMEQYSGDFLAAVDGLRALLGCRGPRLADHRRSSASLCAEYADGSTTRGEVEVDAGQTSGPSHPARLAGAGPRDSSRRWPTRSAASMP